MDRVNVSFAALQMNQQLHFSASIYGFGAGLFFLSYAICEIPSNLLLVRFGARRWLARIMLTWGLLSIAMMFVRTPTQFYIARLALGAAEAGFFPGIIFYLSQWFPATERSRAISRFYIALPLSSVVMGAIAGALLNLHGVANLAGWQWLFLVEGVPAVLLAFIFFIMLPDNPAKARWLSAAERDWLIEQLRLGDASTSGGHSSADTRRALRDPRVWMLGIVLFCIYLGLYGYTLSAPTIVQKVTGLSTTHTGFIIALTGIIGAASMLFNGWHSDRTGERYWHIIVPALLMALGFNVSGVSARPAFALPAFFLIVAGFTATQGPVWTLPSSFLTGTSRAAGIAAINMTAICGGFLGPWWMGVIDDWTGNYQHGLLTLALPIFVGVAVLVAFRHKNGNTLRAAT
jgi:ACS family tartrate transporter-like MFS transporter